jgi:hypothetical protein
MVTWSNVGGGPGNLHFAVFATQVPAQAPAGISCASVITGAAQNNSDTANFNEADFIFSVPSRNYLTG